MICASCGKEFVRHPKANNQKYCAECAKGIARAKQREWHDTHKAYRKIYIHRYYLAHKPTGSALIGG